ARPRDARSAYDRRHGGRVAQIPGRSGRTHAGDGRAARRRRARRRALRMMHRPGLGLAGPTLPSGQFAENVVHFVRPPPPVGIAVGPERTIAALEAVEAVGVARKEDFRAALAAVLLSRQEHQAIFDHAFDVFWRNPRLLEKTIARLLPKVTGRAVPDHGLPSR